MVSYVLEDTMDHCIALSRVVIRSNYNGPLVFEMLPNGQCMAAPSSA